MYISLGSGSVAQDQCPQEGLIRGSINKSKKDWGRRWYKKKGELTSLSPQSNPKVSKRCQWLDFAEDGMALGKPLFSARVECLVGETGKEGFLKEWPDQLEMNGGTRGHQSCAVFFFRLIQLSVHICRTEKKKDVWLDGMVPTGTNFRFEEDKREGRVI